MEGEGGAPPIRLMNFVSEEELEQVKKNRGERVEDGTAQRDRPLFQILKENKDKKDAEFNERFKHRPPKALDEDETEFLDNLEMSRKEYERHVADEEAQQLRSFQAAVAAQSSMVQELTQTPSLPKLEEPKPLVRKNPPAGPLGGLVIKIKPQGKKPRIDGASLEKSLDTAKESNADIGKSCDTDKGVLGGLVSYSDESDEDN